MYIITILNIQKETKEFLKKLELLLKSILKNFPFILNYLFDLWGYMGGINNNDQKGHKVCIIAPLCAVRFGNDVI